MTRSTPILESFQLTSQWPTADPFLFCAHHIDAYPSGNKALGPNAPLGGHYIGQDFEHPDGWNMYHGSTVPGFPQHPHRGFETISFLRSGVVDHADSLGAAARFGPGDVQWMTAGRGIQHSEMFPLLNTHSPNPLELFQIWLNLPAIDKMVEPHFTMFWRESIPQHQFTDQAGRQTTVIVITGRLPMDQGVANPPKPPPHSWASRPESDLAIWQVRLDPRARWTMPAAKSTAVRSLYLTAGGPIQLHDQNQSNSELPAHHGARVEASRELDIISGKKGATLLVLQGRPIAEPIARYGPFVMNSNDEIDQAFADYQETRFGTWSWPDSAPNHGSTKGRFAVHADGRVETPPSSL